ncbi:MAG: HWE histidine kinase domain-containing protein [Rhodospirillales bacterium]
MQGQGQDQVTVRRQQAWRWPLAAVVAATAIPILLFAAAAAVVVVQHSRDNIEQRFAATARALVVAIDTYVLGQLSSTRLLADLVGRDDAGDDRDLVSAVRLFAAEQRGAWLAVVVSDVDGISNTVTFEAHPRTARALIDPEAIRAVAEQHSQTIEPIVQATEVIPLPYLAVRTPMLRDGRVIGVLSVALAPTEITAIAERQQVSADTLITVFDRSRRIVGRSPRTTFIGHQASPSVASDLADGDHGLLLNAILEGERYLRAFETSPITGWQVAVGASNASILHVLQRTGLEVAAAGLVALLASIAGALATGAGFGRRLIARERQMSAAVRASEARYRGVVEASQQLVWTCRADGSVFEDSPTWRSYTGQSFTQLRGFGWLNAIHFEDREATLKRWRATQDTGAAYQAEYRLFHRPSGTYRWVLSRARPLRGDDGHGTSWIGTNIDINERKTIEERQQLLMREVDHRAKNALTVAQAVVQMTRADDIDTFVAAVVGRITALVRAHSLLASNRWDGTPLHRLVEAALLPFGGGKAGEGQRIKVTGPDVSVAPESVQPLAMLLHEFATNAAKYGSLSRRSGSVAVGWSSVEATGELRLTWQERGGPPVVPPKQAGFGSTLVRNLAQRQLEGRIRFEWHPRGLRSILELPPACISSPATKPIDPCLVPLPIPPLRPQGRVSVLIVEDEVLVALSLQRTLGDLGYTVVGPAVSMEEAWSLARTAPIDVALLDVNIHGESALPLAESLVATGRPVVFCSGYGTLPAMEGALAGVQTVGKPPAPLDLARALSDALKRNAAEPYGRCTSEVEMLTLAEAGIQKGTRLDLGDKGCDNTSSVTDNGGCEGCMTPPDQQSVAGPLAPAINLEAQASVRCVRAQGTEIPMRRSSALPE